MKKMWKTGITYKSGGAREVVRGLRQIAAGQVKAENGLIPTPRIVISEPEPVVEAAPKPKRVRKPKAAVIVDDKGSTVSF